MNSPPHRFATAADVAAFAAVPLAQRIAGRDIVAMITSHADCDGEADAIEYIPSGRAGDAVATTSRRQLCDGARAIAVRLKQAGVGPDDVVATLLPNGPATVATAIAALAVATLAPINLYLEPAQVMTLIAESGARVLVLGYCDGQRSVGLIQEAVLREHPLLFPSPAEINRFVAAVLRGSTE